MVFENPTFVELHLHLGEDEESEPETPIRSSKTESEESADGRLKMVKILAMIGFSIGISVAATVAARRVAAKVKGLRGEKDETADSDEAVLEIT